MVMKLLKYTLIVIATLALIASVYNAWHDRSLLELVKGVLPSAVLFYIAVRLRRVDKEA